MAKPALDDRRPAERPELSPVARLTGVGKVYPAAGEDVRALTDISLTIDRGEVVALLGRSGSGKTTLLNLIGTLDRPTSGTIEIGGARVESLPEESLLKLRRETLGFVFQFFHLFPYLSALENAALPLWLGGRQGPEVNVRARELLARVGLADKADRAAGRLSGGEMQRVAIARALVHDPKLVLADEPTGNLDQANAEAVLSHLASLARGGGTALVLATHSEAAAAIADRRVHLVDGRIAEIH
ncbi:MAG TPA: ABC transporter ATP-binding protein [Candidatus Eisenbacteria bacterium]|jgi:ABC-type lipoprotein export system ATPase subunit|nr:ABC transporter ATP-binding protein [Candidatus Eisenbacteria bacterium]